MKKVLLATTALVAFAGAASAEVKLSGYAEIGIAGGSGTDFDPATPGTQDFGMQFWNDIDVTFNLSAESDSGLSFGATIDLDELNGDGINATAGGNGCSGAPDSGPSSHNPGCENDSSVWVSGTFGKVTVGDTDGAFDWALTEIYMGTSIADDHSTHAGAYWNTGLDGVYDGQVMRYEYSFGDFGVAVSAELDDEGTGSLGTGDAALGLGVKWSGDMNGTAVGAGFGYQDNGVVSTAGISANATMANGFAVNVGYVSFDNFATVDSWWGLGLGYTTGALMVQANYGSYDLVGGGSQDGWGLVANYDLGGGAVAMLGYGSGDVTSSNGHGTETWSAGLGLSF